MFLQTGRTRAARDQFTQALLIAQRLKVTKEVARNYDGLGHAAAMEGQLTEARDWWDQALEMYEGLGDEEDAADVRENLKKLDLAERLARGEADPAEAIPEIPAELLQLLSEHPELLKLLGAEADPEAIKQLLRLLGGSDKEE